MCRIGDFGLAVANESSRVSPGETWTSRVIAPAIPVSGGHSALENKTSVCLLQEDGWEEGDGSYVAPELLAAGAEPSPAADVFCLAAAVYECATGG